MCLGAVGRILTVWDEGGVPMAEVDLGDRRETACLLYAPELAPGADVLVHTGFVVEVLDPQTAADARSLRAEMSAAEPQDAGEQV